MHTSQKYDDNLYQIATFYSVISNLYIVMPMILSTMDVVCKCEAVSHVSLADLICVDCSVMCFQMSDFESARQAVFNLIAEHEDIDALLREVSICHYCSTNRNVYLTVVQLVGCLIGKVFGLYIDMPNRDSRK